MHTPVPAGKNILTHLQYALLGRGHGAHSNAQPVKTLFQEACCHSKGNTKQHPLSESN